MISDLAPRIVTDILSTRFQRYQQRIESVLDAALQLPDCSATRLREAMRYSTLGGGKRLRPLLVYTTGEAFGAPLQQLDAAAAAVELIHVYSLIHDDLPAMDDDDMRRGRASCHRAFDEATAILAGDALQALAFEVLAADTVVSGATHAALGAATRLTMIQLLATGIGTAGMAGGQSIDLAAVGQELNVDELENMDRRKTGALIESSVMLGAVVAGAVVAGAAATDADAQSVALRLFGAEIGLAFQIQDDILDVAGDKRTLGKATGADAARQKPTYPGLLGLEGARQRAGVHHARAVDALVGLGERGQPLRELADFVINRAR